MKIINLKILSKLLKGLVDGTLKLVAMPTGKKPRKTAKRAGKKPGRKARKKTPGRKPAKVKLPENRQIFLFMQDKHLGVKLTALAREFHLKRAQIKGLLDKLVARGDLSVSKQQVYYLERQLRQAGVRKKKPEPIAPAKILSYLQKHSPASMSEIAADFGEKKYQRLIRPMNKLEKEKKVVKNGKHYSLAKNGKDAPQA